MNYHLKNPACFMKHRSVRTASSEQVRKPVNRSGQGRWKPYAKNLGPLIDNIDNSLIKSEDIALINS